jgi:hypothetical protein
VNLRTIKVLLQAGVCALVLSAGANAATVSLTFGSGSTELEGGNSYQGERTFTTGGAVVDEYWFFSVPSAYAAATELTVSTANIYGSTSFALLKVQWFDVNYVTSSFSALTPLVDVNLGGALALTLAAGHDYALRFNGHTLSDIDAATYSFDLAVTETPLPPALLLFGSALAGLGFLGRRSRRSMAIA